MHSYLFKAILCASFVVCIKVIARTNLFLEEKVDEIPNTSLVVGGASLVAIGGAGSIVVAINNKNKKYNEPSDEVKKEERKDL